MSDSTSLSNVLTEGYTENRMTRREIRVVWVLRWMIQPPDTSGFKLVKRFKFVYPVDTLGHSRITHDVTEGSNNSLGSSKGAGTREDFTDVAYYKKLLKFFAIFRRRYPRRLRAAAYSAQAA